MKVCHRGNFIRKCRKFVKVSCEQTEALGLRTDVSGSRKTTNNLLLLSNSYKQRALNLGDVIIQNTIKLGYNERVKG